MLTLLKESVGRAVDVCLCFAFCQCRFVSRASVAIYVVCSDFDGKKRFLNEMVSYWFPLIIFKFESCWRVCRFRKIDVFGLSRWRGVFR